LREKIEAKFKSSAKFLGTAKMALTFEGRTLSPEEQKIVLGIISRTTDLEIICVFDNEEENEELLKKSVDQVIGSLSDMSARVFRGVLPYGKHLESETSIIIVGNVEKGAEVISGGSIVVLGSLLGKVSAGTNYNKESFVFASIMNPEELKINEILYEKSVEPKKKKKGLFRRKEEPIVHLPSLATVFEDTILMETVTEDTFLADDLSELI